MVNEKGVASLTEEVPKEYRPSDWDVMSRNEKREFNERWARKSNEEKKRWMEKKDREKTDQETTGVSAEESRELLERYREELQEMGAEALIELVLGINGDDEDEDGDGDGDEEKKGVLRDVLRKRLK